MSYKKYAEENMKIEHEPVPPYRTVFHIAVLVASLYLAVILLRSFVAH